MEQAGEERTNAGSTPGRGESSHEVLARVLDDGVLLVGASGEVIHANGAARALLGGPARLDASWRWLRPRLPVPDPTGRDNPPRPVDVEFPADLGGASVRAETHPVDVGALAAVVILQDQASIQDLQLDLILAQQMRRHASALAQAAHDLKAPLNALTLNAELLRRDLDEDRPERALPRIETIEGEIGRLGRMVQAAMTHSHLPRDAVRRFDLRRLLREVVTLVNPQARSIGVDVSVDLADDRADVLGYRDRLKQCLINLVMNGFEAMPDGGRLSLECHAGEEEHIVLIRDTGCGLPSHGRENLFKLHFTTKSSGTGLGLYTSRAILQRMGGRLELREAEGPGAVAELRLPAHVQARIGT